MGGKAGSSGGWQLQYPGSPAGYDSPQRQHMQKRQAQAATGEKAGRSYGSSRPDPGGGVKSPQSMAPATMTTKPTAGDRAKNAAKYAMMGIATPGTFLAGAAYGAFTAEGKPTVIGGGTKPGGFPVTSPKPSIPGTPSASTGGYQSLIGGSDDDDDNSSTSADLNDFSF